METEIIKQVILDYYKDYIEAEFLTIKELTELHELIKVILSTLGVWTGNVSITSVLSELRQTNPIILDLDLDSDPDSDSDLELKTYLDMLHSRELLGDQRTDEWKMRRHDYITASVSAACAGIMGPASRENQLLEKASWGKYSSFKGGYYTDIGNIYEPVTNSYYSYINNTRIHDFALIPHNDPEWRFLAASTDGVAARGTQLTNIEIKTLPGRVPDGKVKKQYYHQMQHQMACLGLKHSDFIEVKYKEFDNLEDLSQLETPIGIIAELYSIDGYHIYEYTAAGATFDELLRWQQIRETVIKDYQDRIFVRWIYWTQTHYSCINVHYDPQWIKDMGPALKQFYKEMIELRNDPKRVQKLISERETKSHNRKIAGNMLYNDCLI